MIVIGIGKYNLIAGDGDANELVNFLDFKTLTNNVLSRVNAQGDMAINRVMSVLDYLFINRTTLGKSNLH
jgi:hypothetical protein